MTRRFIMALPYLLVLALVGPMGNTALESISGFDQLQIISGNFGIGDQPSLVRVAGFESLQLILGDFGFGFTEALESVPEFNALSNVNSVLFQSNAALETLLGFARLRSVRTYFAVIDNASLSSIDGFGQLKSTGGGYFIEGNPALVSIDGFQSLESVDCLGTGAYCFAIADNQALRTIRGFDSLNSDGIAGGSSVSFNPALDLSKLPNSELGFLSTSDCTGNLATAEGVCAAGQEISTRLEVSEETGLYRVPLVQALQAPAADLASSYHAIRYSVLMAEMVRDMGVTTAYIGLEVQVIVTEDNVDVVLTELGDRLTTYATAIEQRGFELIPGRYETEVSPGCDTLGFYPEESIIEQDGFEFRLGHGSFQEEFRHIGVTVESAVVIDHAANPDTELSGVITDGRIELQHQPSGCRITLIPKA